VEVVVDPEADIRKHSTAHDFDAALTATLALYGSEVYSLLVARMKNDDVAHDVFSQATEDLWKSVPRFQWQCSMRTWFYKLARNAANRYTRAPANRRSRRDLEFRFSAICETVRSQTSPHLRTEIKDRFTELREELPEDDQMLLVLRVNRELAWDEIARIMANDGDDDGDDDRELEATELQRISARLRQRFHAIKDKLRQRAVEEGLLDPNAS